MTKIEAIKAIIRDARSQRLNRASLNRTRKAMAALSLSAQEQIELEIDLEYRWPNSPNRLYVFLLTDKERTGEPSNV